MAEIGPSLARFPTVAHEIARIVYHLITKQPEYNTTVFEELLYPKRQQHVAGVRAGNGIA
jgi:hypothetical protein